MDSHMAAATLRARSSPDQRVFFVLATLGLAALSPVSAKWASQIQVDPGQPGAAIPASFHGYSLEWPGTVGTLTQLSACPTWAALMKELSSHNTGPLVLRIGGVSAEGMTGVPPQSTWDALKSIQGNLGFKFILCLGMRKNNNQLAIQVIQKAYASLPRASIIGFEMGNEPEGWGLSNAAYLSLTKSFSSAILKAVPSTPLIGLVTSSTWISKTLVAPFLQQQKPLGLQFLSAHAYGASGTNASETCKTMLAEDHLNLPLGGLVNVNNDMLPLAKAAGLGVRLTEANPTYSGGKVGVTKTFATSLWNIDFWLTAAKMGVSGTNYHTPGGSAYEAWNSYFGPWPTRTNWTRGVGGYYGHWFFQRMVADGVRFLSPKVVWSTPSVKAWPVISSAGVVRGVFLQKNWELGQVVLPVQQVLLEVVGNYASKPGYVTVLKAPTFASADGITLNARSADNSQPNYAFAANAVPEQKAKLTGVYFPAANGHPGFTRYTATMPPVSAVMIEVATK